MSDSDKVGYGRPPMHSRFSKGQSGNPTGRPRGSRNRTPPDGSLCDLLQAELAREVPVREGNETVFITMKVAILRSIAVNAGRGQARSQRLITDLWERAERVKEEKFIELLDVLLKLKSSLQRNIRAGIINREFQLHPDQIIIDQRNGVIGLVGPLDSDEKSDFDSATALEPWVHARLEEASQAESRARSDKSRRRLRAEIRSLNSLAKKIDDRLSAYSLLHKL